MKLLALPLLAAVAATASPDPAAILRPVTEAHAKAVAGIVACHVTNESTIRSTVWNKAYRTESWQISDDGRPVRTILTRLLVEGKPASEKERLEQEKKSNASFKEGKTFFKAPYDARHQADYTLKAMDARTLAFTSKVHDAQHGDGTITLDDQGRLDRVVYSVSKLPNHVAGEATITFGPVGVGGAIAADGLKATFKGGVGLLTGAMTMTQTMDRYRRFPSLDAAIAALTK